MNYFKHNGKYYFVSRLNGKRSALKQGETLPLRPDARKRYRRETVTEIGSQLVSKNVDFTIALDMSTLRLAGLPDNEDCENFVFVGLREFAPSVRLGAIQYAACPFAGF